VTAEDIQLDKMHPIISDVALSEGAAPTVSVTSSITDVPVTVTTTEPVQTQPNATSQADLSDMQLDKMHPIISGAIGGDVAMTTAHVERSTSDEVMTALEELNDVIASTGHTPPPDHVIITAASGDGSRSSSRHSNISDLHRQTVIDTGDHDNRGSRSNSRQSNASNHENKGSRSSSRQSNHENKGSRSSSQQSNHDNRASRGGSSASSEERRKRRSPPASSARALYGFSAQNIRLVHDKMLKECLF